MTINNRLLKTVKCCLALLIVTIFAPCANLAAEKAATESDLVTFSNQNLRGQDKKYQPVNSWTPYFTWIGNVQDQTKTTYTQATMGVGFLYFSDVKGNLMTTNTVADVDDNGLSMLADGLGSISYNRTPVFEWMYAYKVFSWMDVVFSVQNQSGVNIQTGPVNAYRDTATVNGGQWNQSTDSGPAIYQFRSQLDLNSIMLKLNFELPWVLVWKNWMHALHIGVGVGPGWQSWTDNRVFTRVVAGGIAESHLTFVNTLNQKYSANCVYQIDTGIRMKPATPCADISILMGCKYNGWGQARSVGQLDQQGAWKTGLFEPFAAKVVYSFVPYLGFQWNF